MSRATAALISYIAQQTTNGGTVVLDEIIFANIPNLTEAKLTDTMPTTAQIVHRQAVSQTGFVNNNAVVYSVTLGTEVGDFNFNYIGLINKSKNLLGVAVFTDTIKKTANRNGVQGNAITRSILLEFNGAQALTNITIPAETWQIDFTARLAGMDEALRLSNVDFYGSAAYYGDALKPTLSGNNLTLAAGVAYIGGLRVNFPTTTKTITPPCKLYLDVYETGTVTGAHKVTANVVAQPATQSAVANYKDAQGVQHYIHYFLTVEANSALKDSRVRYWINWHNLKNVPNASTTAKGITALDSSVTSTAEDKAATPKAVKTAYDKGVEAMNTAKGKWTQQDASTTQRGTVQLDSSVSSTAEDKAATPKAVKTAYDKGAEALNVANGKVGFNTDKRYAEVFAKDDEYAGLHVTRTGTKNWSCRIEAMPDKRWKFWTHSHDIYLPAKGGTVILDSDCSNNGGANKVVKTDGSGDVNGRLFRATYRDEPYINGAIAFRVNNSNDNYTRYCNSPSAVRGWLGLGNAVTDIRLGAKVHKRAEYTASTNEHGAGYVITAIGIRGEVDGDDNYGYRPIQKFVNGAWITIGNA